MGKPSSSSRSIGVSSSKKKQKDSEIQISSLPSCSKRVCRSKKEICSSLVVPELPLEIICEILSRLTIDVVTRFRSVCKRWYDLPNDPCFNHLQETQQPWHALYSNTPYLINKCNGTWKGRDFPLKQSNGFSEPGSIVAASCNGLLCLQKSIESIPHLVFNPITRHSLKLYEIKALKHYGCCYSGFGFDVSNNTYKVVTTLYLKGPLVCAAVHTLGDNSWRVQSFPSQVGSFSFHKSSLLFCNGLFHWIYGSTAENGHYHAKGILTLSITDEKFHVIKFPPIQLRNDFQLIQFRNSPAFVHIKSRSSTLRILQIIGDQKVSFQLRTINLGTPINPSLKLSRFQIMAALSNDAFLFKVVSRGHSKVVRYLVVDIEKDEGYVLEQDGVPISGMVHIFQPTLASPKF